jgi:AraC family transcriptional regulator of adaptative response/methylated-DNA-[protein]-cysteine methyltransferase
MILTQPRAQEMPRPDVAWRAVRARDPRFDRAFVYAVRTTGIYCRPTCPSRRPHRINVDFYPAAAAAEGAGYRPCRRCRPHAAEGSPTDRSVWAAVEFLDRNAHRAVTLARLAREVGLSPAYLQRVFTRRVGVSPKRYHAALRRQRVQRALQRGATVSRAAIEVGFGAGAALSAHGGPGALGMTPATYRRGGRGVQIRYAVVPCTLGRLLVAATGRGVCSVALGDRDADLVAALAGEFREAERIRDDAAVRSWAAAIVRSVERGGALGAVPLDLQGTAFQLRVWEALRGIPPGETRTYAALAASIGRPSSARAVGRACATNRVALLVPCHRVVGADGSGGYRWGAERKRQLLEAEAARG